MSGGLLTNETELMHNLLRPGTLLVRQRTRHVRLPAVRWARRRRSEQLLLRALRTPAAAAEITVSGWSFN